MPDALIYAALRTPIGRAGGALATIRPDDLAAIPIRALIERHDVDPATVDDVILGCANQAGEDNRNVARMASLLAGLPVEVPGQTVNRLCGSGLQAVAAASHAIKAAEGDLFVAGGVESMTRAPYVMLKSGKPWDRSPPALSDSTVGWRFINSAMPAEWTISLGETAEKVARRYHITREEQDAFALESQQRTATAQQHGWFEQEIVPVRIPQRKGPDIEFTADEHPRPDVSLSSLGALRPAFQEGGTVTAGSSSGINDGSAGLLVGSDSVAEGANLRPMARIVATAVAGVDPSCMGIGPVPATRKALARAGLAVHQMDVVELNEAFAAQALACIKDLDLDPAKVNPAGGAIALGHPLGCSGARILTTLTNTLRRTRGKYGLATMCIGVGQGIAMIVENIS